MLTVQSLLTVHVTLAPTLHEVRCGDPWRYQSLWLGDSLEQLCFPPIPIGYLQDGGYVPTSIAVVWRWPDSHQLVVKHVLDPFVDKLVRPTDEFEAIEVHKLIGKIHPVKTYVHRPRHTHTHTNTHMLHNRTLLRRKNIKQVRALQLANTEVRCGDPWRYQSLTWQSWKCIH